MSLKAIIYLPMRDSHRMPPHGKFLRSYKHDKHIWEGREYDLSHPDDVEAFNAAIDPAMRHFPSYPQLPKPLLIDEPEADLSSHLEEPIKIKKRHAKMRPGFKPELIS